MFKNYLKITFIILICTGIAQSSERTLKYLNNSYPFKYKNYLDIQTYKGSVKISSWNKEEIQILAEIESTVGGEIGKVQTDLTDIKIEVKDDSIIIKSDYQRLKAALNIEEKKDNYEENRHILKWLLDATQPLLPNVYYDIKLPNNASVNIKDHKSKINIIGVKCYLNIETFKGMIKLEDISGKIISKSYKGKAELKDITGKLTFETYKGNVVIKNARCDMNLDTYKGRYTLYLAVNANFDLDVKIKKDREVYNIPIYGRVYGSKKILFVSFHT